MAPLIAKLRRTTCRVPLQALSLRLSILYQRTCVGLGYGSNSHSFPDLIDFLWKTNHTKHWFCSLEAAITSGSLTLPDNPFVFGEKYYNFFLRYSCQHYLFSYVQTMKHCSSFVLNVPLPSFDISYYNQGHNMSKRHDFGRLSRPVKFSVLNSIRLLRCYTIIKR